MLHERLHALYFDSCCGETRQLGLGDLFAKVKKAFTKATDHVHSKGGFNASLLQDEPVKELIQENYAAFRNAINPAITQHVPAALTKALQQNVFVFSGFKAVASLQEATALLRDENGNLKSLPAFKADILKLNSTYNELYLEAEYQFAGQSARMAARWQQQTEGAGRYNLQYRTANDSKVRAIHKPLHNLTLPADDEFWSKYYPPNGWRCRCTVLEVRKGQYEVIDGLTAQKLGETATTELDKNGNNKLAMFLFNPGKDKIIFPPHHPYSKLVGEAAKKEIDNQAKEVK